MEWKVFALSWGNTLCRALFIFGCYSAWIAGKTYATGGTILVLEHGTYSDQEGDFTLGKPRKR